MQHCWVTSIQILLGLTLCNVQVYASHFRGGYIVWRPVYGPSQNNLPMIEISYRVAFRRSYSGNHECTSYDISGGGLLAGEGSMDCTCSGMSQPMSYVCTDYSTTEDWTTGVNTYPYQPQTTSFEMWFGGCCWISLANGGNDWDLGAVVDLSPRSGGRINSSPTTSVLPIVNFARGCNNTIIIPANDADGDYLRCKWATWRCGGICGPLSGSHLNEDNCQITWNVDNSVAADGLYGVAIDIQDFESASSSRNLSTISVQFLVDLSSDNACSAQPVFIPPTREPGSCIGIPVNGTYHEPFVARTSDSSYSIISIDTVSPSGFTKSSIQPYPGGLPTDYYTTLTWTPSSTGVQEIVCFSATDSFGSSSQQSCITLVTGTPPPEIISTYPIAGATLYESNARATVLFDQEISRPPRSSLITIHHTDGSFVSQLDAHRSDEVHFPHSHILTFDIPVDVMEIYASYYVLIQSGVARSKGFCGVESPAITDTQFWTFTLHHGGFIVLDNNEPSTVVTSPGYPFDYPHSVDIRWVITSVPGTVIEASFNEPFYIEHTSSTECIYDYVEIWDGTQNDTVLGQFCGAAVPGSVRTTSNVLVIRFVTDGSVTHEGFSLNITTGYGGNAVLSYMEPSAFIISPGYPVSYPSDLDCNWTVTSPEGTIILATFGEPFTIQPEVSCLHDFVEVRDGLQMSDPLLGRYCGSSPPPPIASTSNVAIIRLSTDGSLEYGGFHLNLSLAAAPTFLTTVIEDDPTTDAARRSTTDQDVSTTDGIVPTTPTDTIPVEPGDVVLICGTTSFQVDIPRILVEDTFQSLEIHLLGDDNCKGFEYGPYISVNSSLTGCGTEYSDNQTHSFYTNTIVSNDNDTDAIVEYLSLQIPFTCQYNRSKTLTSHFMTINDFMILHSKGKFEYDFGIYTDISYNVKEEQYPVGTQLGKELFFRAQLVHSADNLEIHLRSCRATPSPDFDDDVVYEFIRDDCGVNNAAVRVLTPNDPKQADFEVSSFRFKHEIGNANSEVWVHCEVINCDVDDASSECRLGCEEPRHRRAMTGPHKKAQRIVQGPILIQDATEGEALGGASHGNVSSFPLAASLLVVLGLMMLSVALVRASSNYNHHGYDALPTPFEDGST